MPRRLAELRDGRSRRLEAVERLVMAPDSRWAWLDSDRPRPVSWPKANRRPSRYAQPMAETVTLREITPDNEASVRALALAPGQEVFASSVSESLGDASSSPDANPWYRAIFAGDQPVGFVMLSYDVPPGHPEYPWRYFLWRLLIDARFQRRGYGRAAMMLVIGVVRQSPGATDLYTSAHPGDDGPAPFYRSLGFEPTGEWFDGEEVYRVPLHPAT
jgi:diamine N-acetyltransferase